jgi:Secretion system C-terminal sorting domain
MMKNLLSILAFVAIGFYAQAQCTPNPSYTSAGIYPDTTINLPLAAATSPYSAVIDAVIPQDTVVDLGTGPLTVNIDSIGVTGMSGLPSGFSYSANSASGYWEGGTKGCVLIQGNPTQGQIGVYHLQIFLSTFGNVAGFAVPEQVDTLKAYRIDIRDSSQVSISEAKENTFFVSQNYPNPFSKYTEINVNSSENTTAELVVFNVLGSQLSNSTHSLVVGENKILFNAENLVSGIYMYQLRINGQTITKRMIVNN